MEHGTELHVADIQEVLAAGEDDLGAPFGDGAVIAVLKLRKQRNELLYFLRQWRDRHREWKASGERRLMAPVIAAEYQMLGALERVERSMEDQPLRPRTQP